MRDPSISGVITHEYPGQITIDERILRDHSFDVTRIIQNHIRNDLDLMGPLEPIPDSVLQTLHQEELMVSNTSSIIPPSGIDNRVRVTHEDLEQAAEELTRNNNANPNIKIPKVKLPDYSLAFHSLKICGQPGEEKVYIDGKELTYVRKVSFSMGVDDAPLATIELYANIDLDIDEVDVKVKGLHDEE